MTLPEPSRADESFLNNTAYSVSVSVPICGFPGIGDASSDLKHLNTTHSRSESHILSSSTFQLSAKTVAASLSNKIMPNPSEAMNCHAPDPSPSTTEIDNEDALPPALFYISKTPMDRNLWFGTGAIRNATQPPLQNEVDSTTECTSKRPHASHSIANTNTVKSVSNHSPPKLANMASKQPLANDCQNLKNVAVMCGQSASKANLKAKIQPAEKKELDKSLRLKTEEALRAVAGQLALPSSGAPAQLKTGAAVAKATPAQLPAAKKYLPNPAAATLPPHPWIEDDLIDTIRPGATIAIFDRRVTRLRKLGVPERLLSKPRIVAAGLPVIFRPRLIKIMTAASIPHSMLAKDPNRTTVIFENTIDAMRVHNILKMIFDCANNVIIKCSPWSGVYFANVPTRCKGLANKHESLVANLKAIAAAAIPGLKIDAESILRAGSGPLEFQGTDRIQPLCNTPATKSGSATTDVCNPSRPGAPAAYLATGRPKKSPEISLLIKPRVDPRFMPGDVSVLLNPPVIVAKSNSCGAKRSAEDVSNDCSFSSKRPNSSDLSQSSSVEVQAIACVRDTHDCKDKLQTDSGTACCVILSNAYDSELETLPDWRRELARELRTEACDHGRCVSVHIPGTSDGVAVVYYERESEARGFCNAFDGRWFGGRKLRARVVNACFARERYPGAASC